MQKIAEDIPAQYRMWKEHPDAIPLLPSLSEKEISRQEILYEIMTTELSYNRDLDLIVEVLFLIALILTSLLLSIPLLFFGLVGFQLFVAYGFTFFYGLHTVFHGASEKNDWNTQI